MHGRISSSARWSPFRTQGERTRPIIQEISDLAADPNAVLWLDLHAASGYRSASQMGFSKSARPRTLIAMPARAHESRGDRPCASWSDVLEGVSAMARSVYKICECRD